MRGFKFRGVSTLAMAISMGVIIVPITAYADIFVTSQAQPAVREYTNSGAAINTSLVLSAGDPSGIVASGSDLFVQTGSGIAEYTTTGAIVNADLIPVGDGNGIAISGSDLYVTSGIGTTSGGTIGEYTTSGATVNASLITGLPFLESVAVSGSDLFVTTINGIGEYSTTGATINANLIPGVFGYGIAVSGSTLFIATGGTVGEYTTSGDTINANLISDSGGPEGIAVSGSNIFVANLRSGTVGEYTISGATVNADLISGLTDPLGIAVTQGAAPFTQPSTNSANIASGTNQTATINNPTTARALQAIFTSTTGGALSVTSGNDTPADLQIPGNAYNAGPVDFELPADGSIVQIWDLDFSGGAFNGPVTLMFQFDPTGMTMDQEDALQIYHYLGGQWVDIGGIADLTADTITVETDSFSPFALGLASVPEPASLSLLVLGGVSLLKRRRRSPQISQ